MSALLLYFTFLQMILQGLATFYSGKILTMREVVKTPWWFILFANLCLLENRIELLIRNDYLTLTLKDVFSRVPVDVIFKQTLISAGLMIFCYVQYRIKLKIHGYTS